MSKELDSDGSIDAAAVIKNKQLEVQRGGKIPTGDNAEAAKALGERVQWTSPDGKRFIGTGHSFKELPPGFYDISISQMSGLYVELLELKTEGVIKFPGTPGETVLNEMSAFWDLEKLFKLYELAYKRGVLLYGPPASGKTTIVSLLLQDLIQRGGIALKFTMPELFIQGMKMIRAIQPTVPVVVVMEDLDVLIKVLGESAILNILDGAEDINRVVFIATTNFPEALGPRLINRPSRFDRRFLIPHPDAAGRQMYIEAIAARGRGDFNPDVAFWVERTDGFSLAHIKELFIGTHILGRSFDEVHATLAEMIKRSPKSSGGAVMGFESVRN
jgi:hypothetical protein